MIFVATLVSDDMSAVEISGVVSFNEGTSFSSSDPPLDNSMRDFSDLLVFRRCCSAAKGRAIAEVLENEDAIEHTSSVISGKQFR
jgi:hypothetical protein